MAFSDELREAAAPIWEAQLEHPFVAGIAAGTLDLDRFAYWIRQDYCFLVEYCRLFAVGAARAPDLATLLRFADLLQSTARTEMDLHRDYARDFGITAEELEREEMAPTTRAYTDFLVRTATTGEFAELAAALLPCMWGFAEIGRALSMRPRPRDSRYAAWIDAYAGEQFAELATWCRALVDDLATDAGRRLRERMKLAFVTSSRYELAFWEMAWRQERWPV